MKLKGAMTCNVDEWILIFKNKYHLTKSPWCFQGQTNCFFYSISCGTIQTFRMPQLEFKVQTMNSFVAKIIIGLKGRSSKLSYYY